MTSTEMVTGSAVKATRTATLAVAIILLAAACGTDRGQTEAAATQPEHATTTTAEASKTGQGATKHERKRKPSFTGVHAENYRINYASCSVFSRKQIAKEYKIQASDPVTVAQRYAEISYRPAYRQAAFEGCLDAFLGKPAKVKGAP
jgi:hypothetical protein